MHHLFSLILVLMVALVQAPPPESLTGVPSGLPPVSTARITSISPFSRLPTATRPAPPPSLPPPTQPGTPAPTGTPSPPPPPVQCRIVTRVTQTFFGFSSNDDQGAAIAFDCGRGNIAGGTGTFQDPVTFASAPGEFRQCEVIYSPYLRKYLRLEDSCPECDGEWFHRIRHVAVWVGSNQFGGGDDELDCEDRLTPPPQSQAVIRHPRQNLTVDVTPLFVPGVNSMCNVNHVYPSYVPGDYC
ncbi:hypothetical protein ARAM_001236 [Aspergillus rambellii]|uniref:Uncharacterized protein n=1 Tax=Aspergillus rambellii TaxID=308745 RepID=A0A0F8VUH0_9EURO|nr:hypothetical protein ARAM_001236 [Aspergillus rambellii]